MGVGEEDGVGTPPAGRGISDSGIAEEDAAVALPATMLATSISSPLSSLATLFISSSPRSESRREAEAEEEEREEGGRGRGGSGVSEWVGKADAPMARPAVECESGCGKSEEDGEAAVEVEVVERQAVAALQRGSTAVSSHSSESRGGTEEEESTRAEEMVLAWWRAAAADAALEIAAAGSSSNEEEEESSVVFVLSQLWATVRGRVSGCCGGTWWGGKGVAAGRGG